MYTTIQKHLQAASENKSLITLQKKLEEIVQGDEAFKKQLLHLYRQTFLEILAELKSGEMFDVDYLRHLRHKHKATFEMLNLEDFAQALLQMQERMSMGEPAGDYAKAINQLGEQILEQLNSIR